MLHQTAFQNAFEARLVALSQTHNLLTDQNWEGASLHDLLIMVKKQDPATAPAPTAAATTTPRASLSPSQPHGALHHAS